VLDGVCGRVLHSPHSGTPLIYSSTYGTQEDIVASPYANTPSNISPYQQQRVAEQTRLKWGTLPSPQAFVRLLGDIGELDSLAQRRVKSMAAELGVRELGQMTIYATFFSTSPFFPGAVERVIVVRSSFIHSLIYREKERQLFILMRDGKTYMYSGVNKNTLSLMLNSVSKGLFYNDNIRGKFGRAIRVI
jgi:hypothetical protein